MTTEASVLKDQEASLERFRDDDGKAGSTRTGEGNADEEVIRAVAGTTSQDTVTGAMLRGAVSYATSQVAVSRAMLIGAVEGATSKDAKTDAILHGATSGNTATDVAVKAED